MKLLQTAAILLLTGFSASAGTLTFSSDLGSSSILPGPSLDGTAHSLVPFNDSTVFDANVLDGIVITTASEAPTASNLSAAEAYTEDTMLNLIDIVVSDVDSASVTVTLTLSSPGVGSLSTGTSGTVTSTYNAATGVWTASGAIANVNTLLAGVSFTPTANFNGNFTITTSVSDGALSVNGSKVVTATAINDAPTATNLSAAETYTEDTMLNLIDIVVSDVDSASVTVTLTLSSPGVGSLSTGTSGTVTSTYNAATGVWTASGAIANVNTLLAGVSFTPTANFNGNFTITTSVSDGALSVNGSKVMTATAINDAPVLDASRTPTLVAIAEDAGPPSGAVGTPVSSLVDFALPAGQVDNVTDVDAGALLGIAVTAVDTANGVWYYTLDNGASWTVLGAVSDSSARLLAANANNRVYFQPNPNVSGTLANVFTFRAWDQTSGTDGALANTAPAGGTTAFSAASDAASLIVSALNSAPVLDASKTPTLVAIAEDAGPPSGAVGTLVSSLVDFASPAGQVDNVTDVDAGALLGIAVTAVDTANGTGYYSLNNGVTWTAFGAVSDTSARLLAANANNRVYFQPNPNVSGTLSSVFTFRAWDQTSGTDGSLADATSVGGATAFSVATDGIAITVSAVNDAPVLDASRTPTLVAIAEDAGPPSGAVGTPVSSLVDFVTPIGGLDNVTDVDAGALLGIAVTAVDTANGVWYYTLDNGASWTVLGAVSDSSARLLAADTDTRLYFQPNANFSGTLANVFTFRAWDQTSGTAGALANTAPAGGTTAFSAASDTASLTITPINDAPVLDASRTPTLVAIAEDAGPPSGAVGTPVSSLVDFALPAGQVDNVTDVDAGALLGIAVTAVDTANGVWYYTLDNGASWTVLGAVSDSSARLLAANANNRVYFQPNPNVSGTLSSVFTFRAWDQTSGTDGSLADATSVGGATAFSVATDGIAITVSAVNDAPVLDASRTPTLVAIAEDAGPPSGAVGTPVSSLVDFVTPIGGLDNVTDVDAGALLGIAVTAVDTANGVWYYTLDNGASWTVLGAVSDSSARLLAADTDTRLYFQPNANFSGTLANVFTFRAWDQTSGTDGALANTAPAGGTTAFSAASDAASLIVSALNSAPVLDASKTPTLVAIAEDAGPPSGAVGTPVSSLVDFVTPIGGLDNVTDVDAGALLGIAVTAVDTANGVWYYTLDNGASWTVLGAVSDSSARLLAADTDTRLYFQPNANFSGTLANVFTFRAWDQTSGTDGGLASTAPAGGTTAFSAASDGIAISVIAPPSLAIIPLTPGQATLSWSPNTPGFVLQETWSLSPADWTNSVSGGTNPVVISTTNGAKFYRLSQF